MGLKHAEVHMIMICNAAFGRQIPTPELSSITVCVDQQSYQVTIFVFFILVTTSVVSVVGGTEHS